MVFICAELGANWRGNIVILSRMVEQAKKAGCDAVKFQALSKELLGRHPEWSWYADASVHEGNVEWIDKVCKGEEIEWICTPTYPEAVGFLDPYVKRWKIRHADRERDDLIDQCAYTGKEIIISTDRPMKEEWDMAKPIYCIPKYPTAWGELNFDMIKLLPGYSNHCLDPLACLKAVRYGAEYIEYHITDDKEEFAIDNKVSFSYSQMREINKWIRLWEVNNVKGRSI